MKKLLFLCMLSFTHISTHALSPDFDQSKYPELAKFVAAYRCSEEIPVQQTPYGVEGNFYDKGCAIDRIINAQRARAVINRFRLDRLDVANKCLLAVNAKKEFRVISLRIQSPGRTTQSITHLNRQELEQLAQFVQETGFSDYGGHLTQNFAYNQDGKITFFDTENNTFMSGSKRDSISFLNRWIKEQDIELSADAQEWWEKKLADTKTQKQIPPTLPPIFTEQYDDSLGIDFGKAWQEWQAASKEEQEKNK